MKDKELINEVNNAHYSNEVKKYLIDLINIKFSTFHDLDVLSKIKLDKLEYEIIKYNLISKSVKALEGVKCITKKTSDNFKIKANLDKKHELINMLFLNHININLYDRSNIENIYNSLNLELMSLENKLKGCGHYGYNNDEVKLIQKKNILKDKLNELDIIMKDKEIVLYDKLLNDELEIPKDKGIIVGIDDIYETKQIYSNSKILVYKNILYK